jgi:hypothetical protein
MPVRNRSTQTRPVKSKRAPKQLVVQKRGKEERREDRSRKLSVREATEDEWDWL